MKRKLISLVLLALFGAALLPFETALQTEQKEAHFRSTKLDLPLRAQVGQMGFLAALSGFRSPLAMYLWLQAYDAWEKTEWGKMAGIFDLVTTLQPRSLMYWDTAAWHMAWNASQAAIEDPNQPSEALRKRAQQQYFKLGKEYLERGIANNPDRYNLYERLGDLLRLKLGDHLAAAEAYRKAAALPDSPDYVKRFVGYELAQCPGHEKEAYDYLRNLYDKGDSQRLPSLINYLKQLENKLDVPEDQRIKSK